MKKKIESRTFSKIKYNDCIKRKDFDYDDFIFDEEELYKFLNNYKKVKCILIFE
jgi:hypothetical protein